MNSPAEDMLRECGDLGPSQFVMFFAFCIVNLAASIHYYSQTIILFEPEHWCYHDDIANKSFAELREIYANYSDPSCTPYKSEVSPTSFNYNSTYYSNETQHCDRYIYDLDHGYMSMSSELNWVCDARWKSTIGQSMFFVGSVVGTQIFGSLADSIGRLPVLIFSNIMALIGNGITIFSTNVPVFSMSRFISGLAVDSNFLMMYILVLEYMRPSMRTFGLNLCIGIFYCLGSMVTPWIAVYLASWKKYLIVTSLPIAIVPFFYFILPDSAQWMISKNDIEGAIVCFRRVARWNGRTLDNDTIESFRAYYHNQALKHPKTTKDPSLFDLFKTPRLRKNTLILFFKSMVITLCYDAMSRNVENLGISPFVMFTLSAAAIFPACLVLLALQDRIGRKAMASSSLLISGIFTAISGVIIVYNGVNSPQLLATLTVIGRFGVTVAYNSAAQYATELVPTCVRGRGIATVHVAGYALTFFSAYILYLSHFFLPLPSLVLGVLSLMGAALCLFLPETLNRTLPTTLEDGENFGKGEKFYHFACFDRDGVTESTTVLHTVKNGDIQTVSGDLDTPDLRHRNGVANNSNN